MHFIKKHFLTPSTHVLILANISLLLGVIYFDWDLLSILMLYWAETVIIGIINVFKIIIADYYKKRLIITFLAILFFSIHFAFMMGSYATVILIFFKGEGFVNISHPLEEVLFTLEPLIIGLIILSISHVFSFFYNYLGKKEYLTAQSAYLTIGPYLRVFVIHITLMIGGVLTQILGQPLFGLITLIIIKILIDAYIHYCHHYFRN